MDNKNNNQKLDVIRTDFMVFPASVKTKNSQAVNSKGEAKLHVNNVFIKFYVEGGNNAKKFFKTIFPRPWKKQTKSNRANKNRNKNLKIILICSLKCCDYV